MAISTKVLLLHLPIAAFILSSLNITPAAAGIAGDEFSWILKPIGGCSGSIAECMVSGEMEMESESTRRILKVVKYIGNGAMEKNNVPCSERGKSYYNKNCGSGGEANPLQRGCKTISKCIQ